MVVLEIALFIFFVLAIYAHSVYNISVRRKWCEVKFKELERMLLDGGWYLKDVKGSHYNYIHKTKKGKIQIPHHKGDLKIKTANSILKRAGLK